MTATRFFTLANFFGNNKKFFLLSANWSKIYSEEMENSQTEGDKGAQCELTPF